MDIDTRSQDGVKIVKMKGRLCMGPPLDRFNSVMTSMLSEGHNKIILDLEEVLTIDSSGIGMLMRHLTAAKHSGGSIHLYKPTKFTVQTLKLVGILNLFSSFEDMPAAIASFQ
ncbi:MAG: STAS domain-containing protein [Candidatus Acidiferrum sp.]